jgi:hypothetical protein
VLFRSDQPASFAIHFEANAIVVTVSVAADTRVSVATGAAPAKVKLDGHDLTASAVRYVAADQISQVLLSAGQHEIIFLLR